MYLIFLIICSSKESAKTDPGEKWLPDEVVKRLRRSAVATRSDITTGVEGLSEDLCVVEMTQEAVGVRDDLEGVDEETAVEHPAGFGVGSTLVRIWGHGVRIKISSC